MFILGFIICVFVLGLLVVVLLLLLLILLCILLFGNDYFFKDCLIFILILPLLLINEFLLFLLVLYDVRLISDVVDVYGLLVNCCKYISDFKLYDLRNVVLGYISDDILDICLLLLLLLLLLLFKILDCCWTYWLDNNTDFLKLFLNLYN